MKPLLALFLVLAAVSVAEARGRVAQVPFADGLANCRAAVLNTLVGAGAHDIMVDDAPTTVQIDGTAPNGDTVAIVCSEINGATVLTVVSDSAPLYVRVLRAFRHLAGYPSRAGASGITLALDIVSAGRDIGAGTPPDGYWVSTSGKYYRSSGGSFFRYGRIAFFLTCGGEGTSLQGDMGTACHGHWFEDDGSFGGGIRGVLLEVASPGMWYLETESNYANYPDDWYAWNFGRYGDEEAAALGIAGGDEAR